MSSAGEERLGQWIRQHEIDKGHVPKLPGDVNDPTSNAEAMIARILAVMGKPPMTTRQIANKLSLDVGKTRYYMRAAVRRGQIVMTGLGHNTMYQKVRRHD